MSRDFKNYSPEKALPNKQDWVARTILFEMTIL